MSRFWSTILLVIVGGLAFIAGVHVGKKRNAIAVQNLYQVEILNSFNRVDLESFMAGSANCEISQFCNPCSNSAPALLHAGARGSP